MGLATQCCRLRSRQGPSLTEVVRWQHLDGDGETFVLGPRKMIPFPHPRLPPPNQCCPSSLPLTAHRPRPPPNAVCFAPLRCGWHAPPTPPLAPNANSVGGVAIICIIATFMQGFYHHHFFLFKLPCSRFPDPSSGTQCMYLPPMSHPEPSAPALDVISSCCGSSVYLLSPYLNEVCVRMCVQRQEHF